MKIAMFKRLNKREKWELKMEKEELQRQQKEIREYTDKLKSDLNGTKDQLIQALVSNDGVDIAKLENSIQEMESKIKANDERYKMNAGVLETYSKVTKNDKEGNSAKSGSILGWITGLGGMALGALGLGLAYRSDIEGSLSNKKTLDWAKSFPILRNMGKK